MKQLFTLLLLITALFLQAQTAEVLDLNPGSFGSNINILKAKGDVLVFRNLLGDDSWHLYTTKGSNNETVKVAEFGANDYLVQSFIKDENTISFMVTNPNTTDVYEVNATTGSFQKKFSFNIGDILEVIYNDGYYYVIPFSGRVARVDAVNGTNNLIKAVNSANGLVFHNGFLYYAGSVFDGYMLYQTDGTAAGNKLVKKLSEEFFNYTYNMMVLNDKVVFTLDNSNTAESGLYSTDGTAAGTTLIKNFSWSNNYGFAVDKSMAILDGKMYFAALPAGVTAFERELYVTDGTTSGTRKLDPTTDKINPRYFAVYNDEVYFYSSLTAKMYRTKGEIATEAYDYGAMTTQYGTPLRYGGYNTVFNDKLYSTGFTPVNGDEFYESGVGYTNIKQYDLNPGTDGLFASQLTPMENKFLYFYGKSTDLGAELHKFTPADVNKTIDKTEQTFITYPNPTDGLIIIPSKFISASVSVLDMNGNMIMESKLKTNQLNLHDLNHGMYFIKIADNTGVYTSKIIKQ